ncbi:MAG: penicillin-binding protein 2 [Campylobacterales bacterium]|nr:penicillin-binding protein 2 [Campylobacterales bacterium]
MRIRLLVALFGLIWLALLVRVFYLAVQSNSYYDALSERNTIKTDLILPIRGNIFDRNHTPVAINKLGFKIVLSPHLSRQKEFLRSELETLVGYLPSLDAQKMFERYVKKDSDYNHYPISVADFISHEEIMPLFAYINLHEHIKILPASQRYYPYGKSAAHMIGYVSRATLKEVQEDPLLKQIGFVGKSGIEKSYNQFLEGEPGERVVKVSAYNEEIEQISTTAPQENRNLTLSLDMRLQQDIASMMQNQAGAVVVMDTQGRIVAAGSYPEYDLNAFATGINQEAWRTLINDIDTPFTNKITNGLYPPGSVIKTGLGLIYITTELKPWSQFFCSGSMELGNRNFRCWKNTGHGTTDLNKAIRESCDDYFYKGSIKIGIDVMSAHLQRYGLGQKTNIDVPNEFIGTVPSREWKRKRYKQPWYIGETLNTSIGQGSFLVTPIQITQFTALMATGVLLTPKVGYAMNGETIATESKEVLTVQEKAELPRIRKAMYEVCNHPSGTATRYIDAKIKLAGKTGTAQVVGISQETKQRLKEHEMTYYQRSHAWLSTYGPYENPQFIVTVLIEHGGHGGAAAGGITSRIFDKLLEYGYIKE